MEGGMSHVATVDVVINDLEALDKAAQACGLRLNRDQHTHRWYGHWVNDYHGADAAYKQGINPKDYGKCAHAISVVGNPHAYEIGVVVRPEGDYSLVWDFYAGGHGLMAKVGENCCKLRQEYTKQVVLSQATAMGMMADVQQVDGELLVTLTDYSG